MTNFADLGLPENILHSLNHIGFTAPTPIQEQAIPVILEGSDVLGSAQTGTGKTGAYSIPILSQITNSHDDSLAIILTPTRELAQQVLDNFEKLISRTSKIKTVALIGGASITKQLMQLKKKPRIIVGTPGRVNDHLKRKSLNLKNTRYLVLDETDRMLDMGFGVQLDEIAKFLPEQRQTLMFSATLPKNIVNLSKRFLNNPLRIAVGSDHTPIDKIKQELIKTSEADKYKNLISQLETREGSTLIFVKTKHGAEKLAIKIAKDNQSSDTIHGDLRQSKRERVIAQFRAEKFRILVATDVAARGLDIPHIQTVINYDLPQCPEDYIHRIGRTARAGAEGFAINLLTPSEGRKWKEIQKLINPSSKNTSEEEDDLTPAKKSKPRNSSFKKKASSFKKSHTKNEEFADFLPMQETPKKPFRKNKFSDKKEFSLSDKKSEKTSRFNKKEKSFGKKSELKPSARSSNKRFSKKFR